MLAPAPCMPPPLTSPIPPLFAPAAHSLDEWLDFSSMLARLSPEEFDVVIGGYISEVKAALAK